MTLEESQSAKSQIGKRIRDTRLEKGLIQTQLATATGTNQAAIQKVENGKSVQPRNVERLALELKVNPAWLQWGEPHAEKSIHTP